MDITYHHDKLVSTGNKGKTIGMVEGFRDVLAEGVASTSGGDAPASTVVVVVDHTWDPAMNTRK